jgi:uncharacterized protein YdhG (YjbR/CyaY superfamily)
MPSASKGATVETYIDRFPPPVRAELHAVRVALRALVPDATESMAYGMPTLVLHGNLVHFAAWKKHLGLYGVLPQGDLLAEVAPYVASKGSLIFPWTAPLPLALIERVVAAAAARRRMAAAARQRV